LDDSRNKKEDKKRDEKAHKKDEEEKIQVPVLQAGFVGQDVDSGRLTTRDFPNYKKKVVISNLPKNASIDELFNLFNTYLNTFKNLTRTDETEEIRENKIFEDIQLVECLNRYAVIQINDKEDIENWSSIDGTDWKGSKLKVQRVKKFIEEYNKEIDRKLGLLPIPGGLNLLPPIPGQEDESENKIFMGGIPTSMSSEEVRKLCAGFGMLRSFNLVMDTTNKGQNKGFCFFEYYHDKEMDKAIKALDGFEIMDKKLRVQKADIGAKPAAQPNKNVQNIGAIQAYLKPEERVKIPLYALTASRVVSYLGIMNSEDLFDEAEKKNILREVCDQCKEYGDVVDIKAPSPEPGTGHWTAGVTKVFVKFNHIVAAKQAKFHLSGRRYRGRLIIGSFYPENYFDTNEFDISAE